VTTSGEAPVELTLFERWLAPARPRAKIWRLLLGLLIAGVIWVVWQIALILGWLVFQAMSAGETWTGPEGDLSDLMTGATPVATMILLASFGGLWVGVFAALHLMHRQSLRSLLSWAARFRAGEFLTGSAIAAVYLVASTAAAFLSGGQLVKSGLGIDVWMVMLVPFVLLLFVQTGAEELLFRGYLTQQLAARFRSPIIWAGLPSIGFGLIHFSNGAGVSTEYGLFYVAATLMIALIATVLVWRTGGISAAMGLHFTNNFGALFLVGADGDMSSTQLWLWDADSLQLTSPGELVLLALVLAYVLSPWAPLPRGGRNLRGAGPFAQDGT